MDGGCVCCMRQIDENAKTVEFFDEGASERRQATVDRLRVVEDTGGVGKGVVARVCERHVANAEVVVLAEGGERVFQLVAAVSIKWLAGVSSIHIYTYPSTPRRLAIFPWPRALRISAVLVAREKVCPKIHAQENV